MYLFIRALHVVCGATWLGFAIFSTWFLVPLAGDLGPDAEKLSSGLQRRGYVIAVPVIATLAILSGVWLFWIKGGFTPEMNRTHAGMAFSTGGALAIVAFLLGAIVISRSMRRATTLTREASKTANDAERANLLLAATAFRHRAKVAGTIVSGLLLLTTILMSLALYI